MKLFSHAIESYLLKKINVDRYLPIQLDITNLCNLRCVHCYHPHHKNEGAISLDDWKSILIQYKALVTKMHYRASVVICGGEPLTSPYLLPLLEFVKKELGSAPVSILTNGTLVTEKVADQLQQFESVRFQVSLDGPDSDHHDLIRGIGNFDKALRGLRILKSRGFEVNVLSVLSKRMLPWMEDFFKLGQAESFNSMNFIRFVPEGFGRRLLNSDEDKPLVGLELEEAFEKILTLMAKYQVRSKTQAPLFELVQPGLGRNGRFWESIVVDYQGFIVASSRSKLRLGHALNDGLETVFLKHEVYQALRAGRVAGCGGCAYYNVCGGDRNAAFAASGNFLSEDPGCWKNDSSKDNQTTEPYRRAL